MVRESQSGEGLSPRPKVTSSRFRVGFDPEAPDPWESKAWRIGATENFLADTIREMMEGYAATAVRLAADFNVQLDYSEASLEKLEGILERVAAETPPGTPSGGPRGQEPRQEQLDRDSRVWGGYFGETIRRLWGGEWGVETYPGTVAPVISVDVGGAKIFPVMKAYRRLTQGEGENVWKFYQMIRAKISAAAGRQ